MKTWLRPLGLMLFVTACASGGEGCDYDPCLDASPPRFTDRDGAALEGTVRFPSDGSLLVRVDLVTGAEGTPGDVAVVGPFDVERRSVLFDPSAYDLTIRSGAAAAGLIEAKNSCGRSAQLELVSVPAARLTADVDIARGIDRLPGTLTAGGVALLPGLPITVHFAAFDEAGEKLAGAPAPPQIVVTGGLEVDEPVDRGKAVVWVVGPAGPATLGVVPGIAEPLGFEIAEGSAGVRLEIWRNAESEDWIEGWAAATPLGETLELQVGEVADLALHPFDAQGRLLAGIDLDREPVPQAPPFLEASRGFWIGDALIRALAPGEAKLQVQKAGATGTLRVRVVEAPPAR